MRTLKCSQQTSSKPFWKRTVKHSLNFTLLDADIARLWLQSMKSWLRNWKEKSQNIRLLLLTAKVKVNCVTSREFKDTQLWSSFWKASQLTTKEKERERQLRISWRNEVKRKLRKLRVVMMLKLHAWLFTRTKKSQVSNCWVLSSQDTQFITFKRNRAKNKSWSNSETKTETF